MKKFSRLSISLISIPLFSIFSMTFLLSDEPSLDKTFKNIYNDLSWPGGFPETRCGRGSMLDNTVTLRENLKSLIKNLNIQSILDVACGDFNWMRTVDLTGIDYTGIDIVPEHISNNKKHYESENIKFFLLDGVNEKLPKADLIISRDLLPHLSFTNLKKLIKNFEESGAKYLLSTTFPHMDKNADITTGLWRPINLEKDPINLPKATLLIKEEEETKYIGLFSL